MSPGPGCNLSRRGQAAGRAHGRGRAHPPGSGLVHPALRPEACWASERSEHEGQIQMAFVICCCPRGSPQPREEVLVRTRGDHWALLG